MCGASKTCVSFPSWLLELSIPGSTVQNTTWSGLTPKQITLVEHIHAPHRHELIFSSQRLWGTTSSWWSQGSERIQPKLKWPTIIKEACLINPGLSYFNFQSGFGLLGCFNGSITPSPWPFHACVPSSCSIKKWSHFYFSFKINSYCVMY